MDDASRLPASDHASSDKDKPVPETESQHSHLDADPEKGDGIQQPTTAPPDQPQTKAVDPDLVTWNGPDDPDNPKNWPFRTRWRVTAVASGFAFISPISTSMIAPALITIAKDLDIERSFERQLTLSAFILAYAFGPMIAAPLSELYGRHAVMQIFNAFYLAFNMACGFARSGPQLIVCRFFAGFGGSASAVIAAGVVSDVWRKEERGMAVAIYTSITFLSPTLGPVLGGFITQYSSWRWSFWAVSIADACIQVAGMAFFRETFPPVLLGRKSKALRERSGNQALHTQWETRSSTLMERLLQAFARPILFLSTQPLCQVISLNGLYTYGLTYLVLASFAELWTTRYHLSIGLSGLQYIALALGYTVGTQLSARLISKIYKRLEKSRGQGQPEYRLPLFFVGSLCVPVGLLWYGWSAQAKILWIMPDIGILIFGFGVRLTTQCTQMYCLDVYPTYIASLGAQAQLVRAIAGFTFPLFAGYLYDDLGYGYGNTLLACTALFTGMGALAVLWWYGPALRRRSPYAVG